VVIGTKATVLPGCILGEGSSILAHSLVIGKVDDFAIYSGNPAKFVKDRKKDLVHLEQKFNTSHRSANSD
jgi:acetyltransferase-like isoleucine patch superfamily enzyme